MEEKQFCFTFTIGQVLTLVATELATFIYIYRILNHQYLTVDSLLLAILWGMSISYIKSIIKESKGKSRGDNHNAN